MGKLLSSLGKAKERIFASCEGIASAWIFLLMVLITIDVFGRVLFNMPFQGTPELISSSIVVIAFLELPYVLLKDKHVRSTMFYDKLCPTGKDLIDILAALIGITIFALLIKSSLNDYMKAIRLGEFVGEGALRVPTVPARTVMIIGSGFMIIQFFSTVCTKFASIFHRIKGRHSK